MIVLPVGLLPIIVALVHTTKGSEHLGIQRTIMTLQNTFFGTHFADFVAAHILKCYPCQHGKQIKVEPISGNTAATIDKKLKIISMDFIHLPPGKGGFKYIFTAIDVGTNWPEAIPTKKCNAAVVSKILKTELFPRFGLNLIMACDKGAEFRGKVVGETIESYSSVQYFGTPNNSNSKIIERFNRTLLTELRVRLLALSLPKECWPELVADALLNIRVACDTSKKSPYENLYGVPPSNHLEYLLEKDDKVDPFENQMLKTDTQVLSENDQELIVQDSAQVENEKISRTRILKKFKNEQTSKVIFVEIARPDIHSSHVLMAPAMQFDEKKSASELQPQLPPHQTLHSSRQQRVLRNFKRRRKKMLVWVPQINELVDVAMRDDASLDSKKLAKKYAGPFVVVGRVHSSSFIVRRLDITSFEGVGPAKRVCITALRPSLIFSFLDGRVHKPPWLL